MREEHDEHRGLHHQARHPERRRRGMVLVLAGEDLGEDAALGTFKRQFGDQHRPGQPAEQDREQQRDIDEDGAPMADKHLQNVCRRGIAETRELLLVHQPEGQRRQEEVKGRANGETDEGSGPDLVRHPGAIGHDNRGLDANEDPERHQHRALHLREHASELLALAPDVERELGFLNEEGHDDHGDPDGDNVDEAGEDGESSGPPHARQDSEMHRPDQRGASQYRRPVSPVAEDRKEVAEDLHDQDGEGDIAEGRAEPIAPGHFEACKPAESLLGVAVDAGLQIGALIGQGAEGVGQKEHADQCDDPGDRDRTQAGRARHVLRQIERPAADHRADDDTGQ